MTENTTLFLGMLNGLSTEALRALIASEVPVRGVILPASEFSYREPVAPIERILPEVSQSSLPLLTPFVSENVVHVAWERGIPVYAVDRIGDPEVVTAMSRIAPASACVACFNQRIPQTLLAVPPLGFLNLHPSLLPDYRGPSPLFWIFRNGDQDRAGITVHLMDEEFDTGDIVVQTPVALPDGISGTEAEELVGSIGGALLARAHKALTEGSASADPQASGGSYFSSPTEADFALSIDWSARRAFNFMRGTSEWGYPYDVTAGGIHLQLDKALSYSAAATIAVPVEYRAESLFVQFTEGVLEATER